MIKENLKTCLMLGLMGIGATQMSQALSPADIQTDISNSTLVTFYIAGGSAQANAVVVAANNLLQSGTIDIYTDTVVSGNCLNSNNFRFITGKWNTTTSDGKITAGTPVLIEYHFAKGSYPNGILAVATANPILTYSTTTSPADQLTTPGFQAPSELAPSTGGPPTGTGVACQAGAAYPSPTYSFTTTSPQQITPIFGLSDVELSMFTFPFNYGAASDYPPLTQSLGGNVTTNVTGTAVYVNVFGIAVSNAVFGGSSLGPSGCVKTNFSRQEITGILTGTIDDWGQLYCDNGSEMAAGGITLLDRSLGSGTKAAENSYFLNYPAGIATGTQLTPYSIATGYASSSTNVCGGNQTTGTSTGLYDISEASSQAIVNALNAQPGSGEPAMAAGATTTSGGNCRLIGVLGAEFPPSLNGPGGSGVGSYSYAAIDGVALDANINGAGGSGNNLTYANEINGKYEFQVTNSFNTRNKSVKGSYGSLNGVAATYFGDGTANSSFTQAMLSQMQSASFPGGVTSVKYPSGAPGTLIDPSVNFISPGTACVTLVTRYQETPAPLQPFNNATNAGTSFSCSEPH